MEMPELVGTCFLKRVSSAISLDKSESSYCRPLTDTLVWGIAWIGNERLSRYSLPQKEELQIYEKYCQNKPRSEALWRQCGDSMFFQVTPEFLYFAFRGFSLSCLTFL